VATLLAIIHGNCGPSLEGRFCWSLQVQGKGGGEVRGVIL